MLVAAVLLCPLAHISGDYCDLADFAFWPPLSFFSSHKTCCEECRQRVLLLLWSYFPLALPEEGSGTGEGSGAQVLWEAAEGTGIV